VITEGVWGSGGRAVLCAVRDGRPWREGAVVLLAMVSQVLRRVRIRLIKLMSRRIGWERVRSDGRRLRESGHLMGTRRLEEGCSTADGGD
jgi:hypothetical protein